MQTIEAVGVYHAGEGIGFVLSVVANQKPRDHIEAMLITQTAVAHLAMMRFADELSPRTTTDAARWQFAPKALTGFGRTFANQVSILKQYRSGSGQRVTVRHVSVSDGAEAIVGGVNDQRVIENIPNAAPLIPDAHQAVEPIKAAKHVRFRRSSQDEQCSNAQNSGHAF